MIVSGTSLAFSVLQFQGRSFLNVNLVQLSKVKTGNETHGGRGAHAAHGLSQSQLTQSIEMIARSAFQGL